MRLVGNQGAHFDPAETVSMVDVTQLMSFAQELMKYLFCRRSCGFEETFNFTNTVYRNYR